MNKTYPIIILLLVLFSCSKSKFRRDGIIDRRTVEVKEFPDSLREFAFACEKLPLSQPDAHFLIKEDSLFIFIKPDADKKIHVYSANKYDSLGAYLTKGRGPNEVLLLAPRVDQVIKDSSGINIVIQSFPQYVALMNINKCLEENKTVFNKKFDFMDQGSGRKRLMYESSAFSIMPDGVFFSAQNPNLSGRNIINPCFFTYDYENNIILDSLPKTAFKYNDDISPLTGSSHRAVNNNYKICVAFRFFDAVKIFDFKSKQNIVVKMSKEYPYKKIGEELSTNMMATDEYIFRFSKKNIDNKLISDVQILNWNGDIMGTFNMGGNFNGVWINTEDRAMYALEYDSGDIYKFNLEALYQ